VVAGSNAAVSSNGIDWSVHPVPSASAVRGVAFGNGVFVAYGVNNGTLLVSTDGVEWSSQNLGLFGTLGAIAYGDGQFVALGNNVLALSSDGIVWNDVASYTSVNTFGSSPLQMVYGNGRFVAAGANSPQNALVLAWQNGTAWTTSGPLNGVNNFAAGIYAQGRFTMIGSTFLYSPGSLGYDGEMSAVLNSADGLSWTPAPLGIRSRPTAIAYGNGRYVTLALVSPGCYVSSSTNAVDWTPLGLNLPLADVTYFPEQDRFFAVGTKGAMAMSPNGYHWSVVHSGSSNTLNRIIVAGTNHLVAVGERGTILNSSNGEDWAAATSGTAANLLDVAYGKNMFVAVGWLGTMITSNDGVKWTSFHTGLGGPLRHILFANEMFVATGDDGVILLSADGVSWSRAKNGLIIARGAIVYGDGKFLISDPGGNLVADLAPGILLPPAQPAEKTASFSLLGEIGRVYRVQAATRLNPPDWTDVGSFTATHLTTSFSEPSTIAAGSRFYRTIVTGD
jgi:hypothetical protein